MILSFIIPGQPRPLQRHRTRVVQLPGGRAFAQAYQPKENTVNLATVRQYARDAMQAAGHQDLLFDQPMGMEVRLWQLQPKSKVVGPKCRVSGTALLNRIFPVAGADVDNMLKLICDGCNQVVWRDDVLVCDKFASKRYTTGQPRTEVVIWTLDIDVAGPEVWARPHATETEQELPGFEEGE